MFYLGTPKRGALFDIKMIYEKPSLNERKKGIVTRRGESVETVHIWEHYKCPIGGNNR